jgi:hypothetical protein
MSRQVVVDQRFESEPAKVVWKYSVPLERGPQQIAILPGSRMVHCEFFAVSAVSGEFQIWYEVPLIVMEEPYKPRVFQVFGTGDQSIPKSAKHVHTGIYWNEDRGRRTTPQYVWHLYEYPSGAHLVEKVTGII